MILGTYAGKTINGRSGRKALFSGEDDPGFETLWQDVRGSIGVGALAVNTEGADPIGFVVHITPLVRDDDLEHPDGGWFERDANARVPAVFPLGIPSEAPDPNLTSFREKPAGTSRSRSRAAHRRQRRRDHRGVVGRHAQAGGWRTCHGRA